MPDDGRETEDNMTLDEKLQRERRRQLGLGVTQYAWASGAGRLLVPMHGKLLVGDGPDTPLRELLKNESKPFLDPATVARRKLGSLRPGCGAVGRARCRWRGLGSSRPEPKSGRRNAWPGGVCRRGRDGSRPAAIWWSPDSQWLAFTEVDERHIPVYRIVHQGEDEVGEGVL